jgi:histidine triad (HIT) family protein
VRLELAADPLRRPPLALGGRRPVEAGEVLDGGAQAVEVRLHGSLRVFKYPAAAMAADPDCLFCKIVAGEVPATLVHEDERTIAFMDINPGTRGHLLVIPREHATDVHEIDPEDLQAVALTGQQMARHVRDRLGADGVNLINSAGSAAWQTVFHFHLHVIPRYEGDPLRLPWQPQPGDQDEIAAAARELGGS